MAPDQSWMSAGRFQEFDQREHDFVLGTEPEPTDPGVEPTYRGTERWNGPVQRYANNVNASWTVTEQPERTAVPVEAGLSAQTSPKFIVHGH